MKGKGKGKQIAGKAPVDKNKRGFDDDKTGGGRKRKNPGVIQFFEDEADDFDDSDDSEDSDFSDGTDSEFLLVFSLSLSFFPICCSYEKC